MEIEEEEILLGFEKKIGSNSSSNSTTGSSVKSLIDVVKKTNQHSRSSPKDVIKKSNVLIGKRISKPKGPKGASPPPEGWTATKALQNINKLPLLSRSPRKDSFKTNKRYETAPTPGPTLDQPKLVKSTKNIQTERNVESQKISKKKNDDSGSKDIDLSKEKKVETAKYIPQSLAVIKGKKYVVIKRPAVHQNFKRKPPQSDNKDNVKKSKISKPSSKDAVTTTTSSFSSISVNSTAALSNASDNFCTHFLRNVSIGFEVLFHTFQYLTIKELLCCARVCRLWSLVSNHKLLWRTVRMKNSYVGNWKGFADALQSNSTVHLDMRKMITTNSDKMWTDFSNNISCVQSLENIEMCRCPTFVIENLFNSNKSLKVLNATLITAEQDISLKNLSNMRELVELRLRGVEPLTLKNNELGDISLNNLVHLSFTSFINITSEDLTFLKHLTKLESLELGDCSLLSSKFAKDILPTLTKLKRLRLENGKDNCPTEEILESVSTMPLLTQLELINFDLKAYLDQKLALCQNLRKLLLIPTYQQQSATTNHIILNGILKLTSLEVFTWVVTIELIRVTALYVVQYDEGSRSTKNQKRKSSTGSSGSSNSKDSYDESIPVLKPIPGVVSEGEYFDPIPLLQPNNPDVMPQIEILPLEKIKNILSVGLPTTNFNIIKTPYANTWKQNLID